MKRMRFVDVHKNAEVRELINELKQISHIVRDLLLVGVHLLQLGLKKLADRFNGTRYGFVVRVMLGVGFVRKLGLWVGRKQARRGDRDGRKSAVRGINGGNVVDTMRDGPE